jgi:hypothetical protein
MRSRHTSHPRKTPAAEASVKATQCRASGRSAAQSLDGRRSGGYPATAAQRGRAFAFNKFPFGNFRLLDSNLPDSLFPYLTDSMMVPAQQPEVPLQHPFWGDVSPYSRCRRQRVFCSRAARDAGRGRRGCQDIRELGSPIHSSRGRPVWCGTRRHSCAVLEAHRIGELGTGEVPALLP